MPTGIPKSGKRKNLKPNPSWFKKGRAWNESLKKERPKGKDAPNWKGGYENRLWHNRQRRIMKKAAGGSHTLGEWENLKAQYDWICLGCGKREPEITLTVDHVISLKKGGSDNIENIQPLCMPCNSRKGNRHSERFISLNESEKRESRY